MLRFKRDRVNLGKLLLGEFAPPAEFVREGQQGHVHGVAAPFPAASPGVQVRLVAKHPGPHQRFQYRVAPRIHRRLAPQDDTMRREPFARDGQAVAVGEENFAHRQFVHGERAGLVCGDEGATAEPLHGGEASYHHMPPGHARHGDRQCHRHGHGQP